MNALAGHLFLLHVLAEFLGGIMFISGTYGLWDIARFQVDVCHACGVYTLPFGYDVPWYIAGDGFVLMSFLGTLIFILVFLDRFPE